MRHDKHQLDSLPVHGRRSRARALWLVAGFLCLPALFAGCATKDPPKLKEIQEQAGLTKLELEKAWRAGAEAGDIQDNWLATFQDQQLNELVAEGMAHNPDLRVAATKVEQATQYVELAKAALRPAVGVLGTGGLNMGGGDINSALQGISLGVSWEPDLWARMR